MAAEWSGCRIQRIVRVQTVKLVGPGLSSTSPERRRKARRKKPMTNRVCGRVRRKKMGYELSRSFLGRRYDTGKCKNDECEKMR